MPAIRFVTPRRLLQAKQKRKSVLKRNQTKPRLRVNQKMEANARSSVL
jgi:hypothetical protein